MTDTLPIWATEQAVEDGMNTSHGVLWRRLIELMTERDLRDRQVLDFGCNQGGLLRALYHARPYAWALGVDIAEQSVARARELRGPLPAEYRVVTDLASLAERFDLALSHEVLYLLADLGAHARDMFRLLRPGGVYYVAIGCHADHPDWATWQRELPRYSRIPVYGHALRDYVDAFRGAGFQVYGRYFRVEEFLPLGEADALYPEVSSVLHYYDRVKTLFRMVRPTTG